MLVFGIILNLNLILENPVSDHFQIVKQYGKITEEGLC